MVKQALADFCLLSVITPENQYSNIFRNYSFSEPANVWLVVKAKDHFKLVIFSYLEPVAGRNILLYQIVWRL